LKVVDFCLIQFGLFRETRRKKKIGFRQNGLFFPTH
jgi:hypothetical protein